MIGLFLAMLELIREKLIWTEQSEDSTIYLRALTDEPAEKAVQRAILATEAELEEIAQTQNGERQSIPIQELSDKSTSHSPIKQNSQQEHQSIPITELPQKEKSAASSHDQQEILADNSEESEPDQAG
jgi:hypothetical protein